MQSVNKDSLDSVKKVLEAPKRAPKISLKELEDKIKEIKQTNSSLNYWLSKNKDAPQETINVYKNKIKYNDATISRYQSIFDKALISKPVNSNATADSTKYFKYKLDNLSNTDVKKGLSTNSGVAANSVENSKGFLKEREDTRYNLLRQYRKGMTGFDKNGNPLKK
jgi:multidrug resistance efflux pump